MAYIIGNVFLARVGDAKSPQQSIWIGFRRTDKTHQGAVRYEIPLFFWAQLPFTPFRPLITTLIKHGNNHYQFRSIGKFPTSICVTLKVALEAVNGRFFPLLWSNLSGSARF